MPGHAVHQKGHYIDPIDSNGSGHLAPQKNIGLLPVKRKPVEPRNPDGFDGYPALSNYSKSQKKDEECDLGSSISVARLWNDIMETAKFGQMADCPEGMYRIALSKEDQMVRDWFKNEAQSLGCEVRVDQVGNIFAVLPGACRDIPPIGIGSHLDTQPAGGRFDGILGVLSGLEILRTIKDSGRQMYADVAVINWTNEEGAGYQSGCTGSAVWSGHVTKETALNMLRADRQGTFGSDLLAIDYQGSVPASHVHNGLSAHFELHIEQGKRLEAKRQTVGVVTNIQGIRWIYPMKDRVDALVAASEMVCFLNGIAREYDMFATVGVLEVEKASSNIVADNVRFTVDLRHRSEDLLCRVESELKARMKELTRTYGPALQFDMHQVWHSPAAEFDQSIVEIVRRAAITTVGESQVMPKMISFAGHDSALVHLTGIPTAMIFVPSHEGVSHAPEEFTEREHCGAGAAALYRAVCLYDDRLRASSQKHKVEPEAR
ncbi:hypothetical protein POX_e06654 [Penicillium oxalicum]|uniref:hypothetical protein n=1 Tax=Penicillium oxalicum TaxID=69781 RepID=UPI0020B81461|nr:hypothetical protein POX_e06654 [Penicillium oxalicum]KAI2788633.1 hypothetical protein POX_e06654 [Penicillium oxalicum]